MYLNDDEYARLGREKVEIFARDLSPIDREVCQIDWDIKTAEKGGYDTFTLKEIHEPPRAIWETLSHRIKQGR